MRSGAAAQQHSSLPYPACKASTYGDSQVPTAHGHRWLDAAGGWLCDVRCDRWLDAEWDVTLWQMQVASKHARGGRWNAASAHVMADVTRTALWITVESGTTRVSAWIELVHPVQLQA